MYYSNYDMPEYFPAKKPSPLDGDSSFDDALSFFTSDDAKIVPSDQELAMEQAKMEKQATATPKKKRSSNNTPATPAPDATVVSYANTYGETTDLLRQAILQADVLTSEIKQDIDTIRGSKTMKGKYTYITNLTSAEAGLIGTKISAIKEINNTITQAHQLELRRAKDIKEDQRNQQSDDARMMDMYNAFINSPMGMYNNTLNMPKIPDMLLGTNGPNPTIQGVTMVGGPMESGQLTPEQVRMRMESNPNIEEVVMYEPSSGRRWFEVIDNSTNMPVQNYPKTDDFFLSDMTIDVRAGTARNRNLDKVWRLINIEGSVPMSEY